MKVDLCDLRRQFRAYFFASDRDITLQADRILVLGDGTEVPSSALVPIGGIILWSGAVVDIPDNWQICNGTNGTPDLRNSFVIGAGDTYAVDDAGGSATKDVSHTHGPGTLNTANDTHNHDVTGTSASDSHSHGDGTLATATEGGGHIYPTLDGSGTAFVSTTTFEDHTHDVTGSTASDSHSHGDGTYATDNDSHDHDVDSGATASGGSATQDVLNPYYALAYIQRLS